VRKRKRSSSRVTRRALGAVAVTLTVAATITAAVALAALGDKPVVATERPGGAADDAPDLTRVSLQRSRDGRLRAGISLAAELEPKDLVARSGPPGSVCLRLYTSTRPGALPPDYLVCVTADARGRTLRGTVLAEQVNALPKKVGTAAISRTSSRSVVMRFSQRAIGGPSIIRFAAEATRAGCIRASCVDTLPDAPKTSKLTLRLEAPPDR